jgi:hypothetical protein
MKLIEMLVRHLPKWPIGVEVITQPVDGVLQGLAADNEGKLTRVLWTQSSSGPLRELAEDHTTAQVTERSFSRLRLAFHRSTLFTDESTGWKMWWGPNVTKFPPSSEVQKFAAFVSGKLVFYDEVPEAATWDLDTDDGGQPLIVGYLPKLVEAASRPVEPELMESPWLTLLRPCVGQYVELTELKGRGRKRVIIVQAVSEAGLAYSNPPQTKVNWMPAETVATYRFVPTSQHHGELVRLLCDDLLRSDAPGISIPVRDVAEYLVARGWKRSSKGKWS